MTDMPNEIWAFDNQLEYPRLWETEFDEGGVHYTRTDWLREQIEGLRVDLGDPLIKRHEMLSAKEVNAVLDRIFKLLEENNEK